MLKTSKRKSTQSKWQRICKSCRRRRFRKRRKSCKIRKNQRRSSNMRKKQLKSQAQMQMQTQMQMQMRMQMQANKIWLPRNSRQNHKKYRIAKEDSLSISKIRTELLKTMNNTLKKAKIDLIVITIVKTQKRNNIVLTVLKKYIAEVLLAQRAIWEHVFDVKSIKKDEKWHKIIIHSLKTEIFNTKTEMKNLKTELES